MSLPLTSPHSSVFPVPVRRLPITVLPHNITLYQLNMRPSSVPAKRKASASSDEVDDIDDIDDMASTPPPSKSRKRVPAEIWETKRPIITRLYQEEKRSLKEVMDIMERDYNFTAT
jgi:hypothetical protein